MNETAGSHALRLNEHSPATGQSGTSRPKGGDSSRTRTHLDDEGVVPTDHAARGEQDTCAVVRLRLLCAIPRPPDDKNVVRTGRQECHPYHRCAMKAPALHLPVFFASSRLCVRSFWRMTPDVRLTGRASNDSRSWGSAIPGAATLHHSPFLIHHSPFLLTPPRRRGRRRYITTRASCLRITPPHPEPPRRTSALLPMRGGAFGRGTARRGCRVDRRRGL